MDVEEENEQIISSDEYSDEDDDDDALMNDAIRAQNQNIRSNDYSHHQQPNWRIDQRQKELSSLLRRNKISVIYKKRSIKWLNSKRQRDRYKKHIYLNAGNFNIAQKECPAEASFKKSQSLSDDQSNDAINIQDIVSIKKIDADLNLKSDKEEVKEVNKTLQNNLSTFINYNNQIVNIQPESVRLGVDAKTNNEEENIEDIQKKGTTEKAENSRKRSRSKSSSLSSQSKESPQFDLGINNIFSKFDKIATNHVSNISNNSLKTLNEKMESLSTEIDIINEVLHAKEKELNRLSYLKMVKEEIYFRLNRKLHTLQKRESFSDKQQQNTLLELKELEIFLSDKKDSSTENFSSETIQKIIENRANMNADDLEREKNNTSRLHSLLVSQNMLRATELLEKTCFARNVKKINTGLTNQNCERSNHLDEEKMINTKGRLGRLGEERDVKRLIADFREKNNELLPRVGKRIESTELNTQKIFRISLLDKLSSSPLFNKEQKSKFLPNSLNEISLTSIGRPKKMSSSIENDRIDDNFAKHENKGNLNGKLPRNIQYPLCQECKTKESRFVCAGCGNQWYCSKNCQVTAWDTHSEMCTE